MAAMELLQESLSIHLDAIQKLFTDQVKVTLVVRNIQRAEADVVIGNDDLDFAIATIETYKLRDPLFKPDTHVAGVDTDRKGNIRQVRNIDGTLSKFNPPRKPGPPR